jgi:hypothetical protein
MVSNIRETNKTLNLTTNAGVLTTKLKADVFMDGVKFGSVMKL